MTLADLGADVVKVERPESGDDTRAWGPPWSSTGDSTYYLGLNRGKQSVVLDFDNPHELGLAQKLAERADVVIENFRPGLMDDFGLSYQDVRTVNPGVVYCSISGFGASGPAGDLPGYDLMIQAMSGLMSITGPDEETPTKVGAAVTDMISGLYAATGVVAALYERMTTGRGRQVEVSLFDSALNTLLNQGSAFLNSGTVPRAQGNRHPSIAPYEAFSAADREFIVAAANDKLWQALCRTIGRDDLLADERYSTNARRRTNVTTLVAQLNETLATKPADEWMTRLRDAGVPTGPINQVDEAFAWAEEMGLAPVVTHAGSSIRTVRSPILMNGEAVSSQTPPPKLDEHGSRIRAWLESDQPEI